MRILTIILTLVAASPAMANPDLDDLRFLEGHWRGGEDFVFEEIWSAPEGRVMTGMARGVASGALRILEYIIIAQEEDGEIVMRFKHYNADFTHWDGEETPLTLTLEKIDGADAMFTADPPSHTVKSIRYWMPDSNTLQVDVVQVEDGEKGGFSLVFKRMN